LDKTLQKYPDLAGLIEAWPKLPEDTKTAIIGLIRTYKAEKEQTERV
jgi:hypothetical protein